VQETSAIDTHMAESAAVTVRKAFINSLCQADSTVLSMEGTVTQKTVSMFDKFDLLLK